MKTLRLSRAVLLEPNNSAAAPSFITSDQRGRNRNQAGGRNTDLFVGALENQ